MTNIKSFEPTEFAIYSNKGEKNKIYSFKLSKWFVVNPDEVVAGSLAKTIEFCNSLPNYRLAVMGELTNASAKNTE